MDRANNTSVELSSHYYDLSTVLDSSGVSGLEDSLTQASLSKLPEVTPVKAWLQDFTEGSCSCSPSPLRDERLRMAIAWRVAAILDSTLQSSVEISVLGEECLQDCKTPDARPHADGSEEPRSPHGERPLVRVLGERPSPVGSEGFRVHPECYSHPSLDSTPDHSYRAKKGLRGRVSRLRRRLYSTFMAVVCTCS